MNSQSRHPVNVLTAVSFDFFTFCLVFHPNPVPFLSDLAVIPDCNSSASVVSAMVALTLTSAFTAASPLFLHVYLIFNPNPAPNPAHFLGTPAIHFDSYDLVIGENVAGYSECFHRFFDI